MRVCMNRYSFCFGENKNKKAYGCRSRVMKGRESDYFFSLPRERVLTRRLKKKGVGGVEWIINDRCSCLFSKPIFIIIFLFLVGAKKKKKNGSTRQQPGKLIITMFFYV